MLSFVKYSSIAATLLAGSALADATSYSPHATGFTLPNAQQAVSALSAQTSNYATTAGYATSAGSANTANYSTLAGSATTATNATNAATANYATTANAANSAGYATNAGVASQAAELTAGDNCGAGTALTVTGGILGCVSSVTSITGQLNGAQIVGDITNVGSIYANGYVAARQSLYSDGAVYSNGYAARDGSGTAAFYGNASTANAAATVTGQVNGAQIVGNLNVGSINATGNIVSNGYTYGIGGLFTDNAVFSNTYVDRNGGGSANFYGNASTANAAATVTGQVNGAQIVGNLNVGSITASGNIVSNGYTYGIGGLLTDNAVYSNTYVDRNGGGSANFYGNASTANYAASSDVGILYQGQAGVSSSYYCDPGYYLKFYDTNVDSTNNAFFYGCVAYGH